MHEITAEEVAIDYAKRPDKQARANAGVFLAQLGTPSSLAAVEQLLDDADEDVRSATLFSLMDSARGIKGARAVRSHFPWSAGSRLVWLALGVAGILAVLVAFFGFQLEIGEPASGWFAEFLNVFAISILLAGPLMLTARPTGMYPNAVDGLIVEYRRVGVGVGFTGVVSALAVYFLAVPDLFLALVLGSLAACASALIRLGSALAIIATRQRGAPFLASASGGALFGWLAICVLPFVSRMELLTAQEIGRLALNGCLAVLAAAVGLALIEQSLPKRVLRASWSLKPAVPIVARSMLAGTFVAAIVATVSIAREEADTAVLRINDVAHAPDSAISFTPRLGVPVRVDLRGSAKFDIEGTSSRNIDLVGLAYNSAFDRVDRIDERASGGAETLSYSAETSPQAFFLTPDEMQTFYICFERYNSEQCPTDDLDREFSSNQPDYDAVMNSLGTRIGLQFPSEELTGSEDRSLSVEDANGTYNVSINSSFQENDDASTAKEWLDNLIQKEGLEEQPEIQSVRVTFLATKENPSPGIVVLRSDAYFPVAFATLPKEYEFQEIDFGDNSSQYANDGECDDNRFTNSAWTDEAHVGRDASDCRAAVAVGRSELREDASPTLDGEAKDEQASSQDKAIEELVLFHENLNCEVVRNSMALFRTAYSWNGPRTICEAVPDDMTSLDTLLDGYAWGEADKRASPGDMGLILAASSSLDVGTPIELIGPANAPDTVLVRNGTSGLSDVDTAVVKSADVLWAPTGSPLTDDYLQIATTALESEAGFQQRSSLGRIERERLLAEFRLLPSSDDVLRRSGNWGLRSGGSAGIDFGDDSGQYALDGACDDNRFVGSVLTGDSHVLRDASDCKTAFRMRTVSLPGMDINVPTEGIDFGDNSGVYANDGACDDNRFVGSAITGDSHVLHDAVDCERAYEEGRIRLKSLVPPPGFVGGLFIVTDSSYGRDHHENIGEGAILRGATDGWDDDGTSKFEVVRGAASSIVVGERIVYVEDSAVTLVDTDDWQMLIPLSDEFYAQDEYANTTGYDYFCDSTECESMD